MYSLSLWHGVRTLRSALGRHDLLASDICHGSASKLVNGWLNCRQLQWCTWQLHVTCAAALLLIGGMNELHQALAGNLPVHVADVHDNINAGKYRYWSLRMCTTV